MSKHTVMAWAMPLANGDRFRAPDGTTYDVVHTGLTMDQCQRIAYADWKKAKKK